MNYRERHEAIQARGSASTRRGAFARAAALSLAASVVAVCVPAFAAPDPSLPEIEADPLVVETLGAPGPHWIWLNDGLLPSSRLFDAGTGNMLGMVSTSSSTSAVEWSVARGELVNAAAYYSRGTYGDRTDVVQIRSLRTLLPIGEVVLPPSLPKIANGYPLRAYSGLLDGGRFMAIYNFNPVMSVSVVDVAQRRYAGEIQTAGCALVMPTAADTFIQLCGDGTVQRVRLDRNGQEANRARTEPFFDAENDPLIDRPARNGDSWWFTSYSGKVYRVSGSTLAVSAPWRVQGSDPADAGWRPGGRMPIAVHRSQNRLFVLMHEGGMDTHEHPGPEVWVFDATSHARVARFTLAGPAVSIDVSQGAEPLLYALNANDRTLDVYSATDGTKQRSIGSIGVGVSVIQAVGGSD